MERQIKSLCMILRIDFKINTTLVLCLLALSLGYGQDLAKNSFPEAYFGVYKGDLKITNPKGVQTIAILMV